MKQTASFSFIFVFMLLLSFKSQAYTCERVTPTSVITVPNLTIQRDLPVGSQIGAQYSTGTVSGYNCSNTYPALTAQAMGVKSYGTYVTTINGRRIFSTSVPGIGFAVGVTTVSSCNGYTGWVNGSNPSIGEENRLACGGNGILAQQITSIGHVVFYKTAETTGSGTVNARNVGAFIVRNNDSTWITPESCIQINSFSVTTLACSVNNTVISVPMGDVDKHDFSGVGSSPRSDKTRSFNIPLTCDPGARVNIKIEGDAQNATQGVLNLTSGANKASGVGIQLLYNDAPLTMGTSFFLGTNASQGEYTIPLKARYYQTGATMTPGTANGSATFTMIYQ
ncbi:MAG: Type-1 fimbrial protein, A chain [Candidatus Erwinia impunctatus]|nr:Type-1 fimbrial protein, A chain [Culicoides impunctatus]